MPFASKANTQMLSGRPGPRPLPIAAFMQETEVVEDFMRTLQQFGKTVAPLAQKALPGVISGAAQGSAFGPYGALIGAVGGGAASLLSGAGQPAPPAKPEPAGPATAAPAPPTGPTPVATVATAPAPIVAAQTAPAAVAAAAPPTGLPPAAPVPAAAAPALPQAPGPGAGGSPSDLAARLLGLLTSRQTAEALLALMMADLGKGNVTVANRAVPTTSFANAIAEVAADLADAAGAWSNGAPTHLMDPQGNPRCDLPNPRARAALLL